MKRIFAVSLMALTFSSQGKAEISSCKSVHLQSSPALPKWARLHTTDQQVQYLKETFQYGSRDYLEASRFGKTVASLPTPLKDMWIRSIGTAYRQIPKKSFDPMRSYSLGGRRLLDRALSLIQRTDEQFLEATAHGISPREAFNQFLDRQTKIFSSNYTKKEVWAVIHVIQQSLRNAETSSTAPAKVLLSGSFANGKAHLLSSDIDLGLSDARLLPEISKWQSLVEPLFHSLHPQARMEFEPTVEPAAFYGATNPIVIEITAHSIQVLVFPPAEVQIYDLRNLRASEPTAYRIED